MWRQKWRPSLLGVHSSLLPRKREEKKDGKSERERENEREIVIVKEREGASE